MMPGNPTTGPQRPRIDVAPPSIIPNWQPQTPISVAPRQTLEKTPDTFERQVSVAALNELCRVTLGRDRIGGQVLRPLAYGTSLLLVVHWGRGPIEQIEGFTVADAAAPSVIATHYLGTAGQAVDAKLVSAFAAISITHTDAFPGHVYSVFEFPVGTDIGDIHVILKGVKPYDPRNGTHVLATPSTWTYSDNPALLLAHVITNTTYGLGAAFDWTGSIAAFNACDNTAPGEKKRLIGLTMDRRMPAHEWCEILRAHAGCYIIRSEGMYRLVPDIAGSSVRTFTKADIIKGTLKWGRTGLNQQPNVVQVTYTDPSVIPWKTATAIYPANGIPPAGEEPRLTMLDLAGVHRYSQAMREVHERRGHGRLEALTFSFDTFADAILQEPGDICTLNDGGLFGGVLFRLLDKRMSRKGRWTITGKKYDPAVYNNSSDSPPTYGDTTLPSVNSPPTVGSVTLTEQVITTPTGAIPLSTIRGTWPASVYPFLDGYRVIVRNPANEIVDDVNVPTASYQSPPLPVFVTYSVSVYARSQYAQSATASTASISLVGSGFAALAAIWSAVIPTAGWTFVNGVQSFKLWDGDPYLRLRTSVEPVETAVYTGSNMLTPGRATQVLDAYTGFASVPPGQPPWMAQSPIFDIGTVRNVVFTLLNVTRWTTLYAGRMRVEIYYGVSGVTDGYGNGDGTLANARYAQIIIQSAVDVAGGGGVTRSLWQIEFDTASLEARMPTVTDPVTATSSASGPVTVTLPRKYIVVTNIQITALSSTQANPSYSNLVVSEVSDNTLQLHCYDAANARVAVPCSIQITGVAAP